MSKWKLLTCAACGNQMHCSSTSLPQGQAKCNPCRRDRGEWRPRSGSLVMRPCVVCDTEVQAPAVKCAAHKAWKRTTCSTCAVTMYGLNRNKPGRNAYCSDQCRPVREPKSKQEPQAKPLRVEQCAHCYVLMIVSTQTRKYCGRECAREAGLIMSRAYRRVAPPTLATCIHCATEIGYNTRRKVCDDCRPLRTQVQKGKHRARARHFGVEYEEVNAHTVYERDNWVCGICHEPVDETLKWPDRMCASLDHIHPMSKGGGHTYANSQLAHHRCNTLKSNHVATARIAA